MRTNWLIAATLNDAKAAQAQCPQLRSHLIITPNSIDRIRGFTIGEYVFTPKVQELPAKTRMRIRTAMAPSIDEQSREEPFPANILAW